MPGAPHPILNTDASGRCAFFEPERGNRCGVHRSLGHAALPAACRHFPRHCVLTPLGVSITLSHYCPTVAATLQRPPAALELVSSPPAFPPAAYVGLDARLGPPPWLRPDEWMCWDSHRLWEAHAVATLADAATPPENALGLLMREAEVLRQSDPATLLEHIAALDAAPRAGLALPALNPFALHDLVVACVPAGDAVPAPRAQLEPALERWVAPAWSMHAHAIRRYLAAKAVANWCAVQGDGLRTAVWFLVVAWAVLRVEAARVCAARATALDPAGVRAAAAAADLLLIHLVALERLAARLSQVERSPVWPPPPHGSV